MEMFWKITVCIIMQIHLPMPGIFQGGIWTGSRWFLRTGRSGKLGYFWRSTSKIAFLPHRFFPAWLQWMISVIWRNLRKCYIVFQPCLQHIFLALFTCSYFQLKGWLRLNYCSDPFSFRSCFSLKKFLCHCQG